MVCLQWLANVWFLGVRNEKKRMGLRVCVKRELGVKSGGDEIMEDVTIRLMVCQGYIRMRRRAK